MSALLLPFASRRSDGLLVSPQDVPRGLECNCTCPGCGHAVMSKQGTEKVWHFAHHRSPACVNGYEKSVHELAKQLIRQRKQLLLPMLEAVVGAMDAFGRPAIEQELVFNAHSVELDTCRSTVSIETVTADVLGQLKGREVIVEISVFHRLAPEKKARLINTGIAAFEIDLSRFKREQATLPLLEAAIFSDTTNRQWLYHAKLGAARAIANARLQVRLAEAIEKFNAEKVECERRQAEMEAKHREALSQDQTARHFRNQEVAFREQRTNDNFSLPPATWRAGTPSHQDIHAAQVALSVRTGKTMDDVVRVTGQVTKRSQLQGVTPLELSQSWASALGLQQKDILRFLYEANFIFA